MRYQYGFDVVKNFWAVTSGPADVSLWKVESGLFTTHYPYMEKVQVRGRSQSEVGARLFGRLAIAVASRLIFYSPIDTQALRVTEPLESVPMSHWGNCSPPIAALFLESEERDARQCLHGLEITSSPEEWIEATQRVHNAIGNEHPVFEVCDPSRWEAIEQQISERGQALVRL